MMSSNFPRIYSQVTAAETYEGENTVMWLQSARFLRVLLKIFIITFTQQSKLFLIPYRFLVKNEADRASLLSNFTKDFSNLNQIVGLFQQVSSK